MLRDESTTLDDGRAVGVSLDRARFLLEMKSQRLLPGRDGGEPDEEFVGWEERDVLLARLLELRTYAALADAFVSLFERASRAFPRLRGVDDGFEVDAARPAGRRHHRATGAGVPARHRGEARAGRAPSPRHRRRGDRRRNGRRAVTATARRWGDSRFAA